MEKHQRGLTIRGDADLRSHELDTVTSCLRIAFLRLGSLTGTVEIRASEVVFRSLSYAHFGGNLQRRVRFTEFLAGFRSEVKKGNVNMGKNIYGILYDLNFRGKGRMLGTDFTRNSSRVYRY